MPVIQKDINVKCHNKNICSTGMSAEAWFMSNLM